jgi:acetyl esterase/lipase
MGYLRRLLESQPMLTRIPAQSTIASGQSSSYNAHVRATGDSQGRYAFIYIADGHPIGVDLTKLAGSRIQAQWFDPRTGTYSNAGTFARSSNQGFDPPGNTANGNDWVLVLTATETAMATPAPTGNQNADPPIVYTVYKGVEYARVGNKSLLLDLYLPHSKGSHPLIIWIHGGAWLEGSRALKSDAPVIRQLERGYAVASIDYRLSQEAKFPAQIFDCKAAVRWLRAKAATYNLDPDRFAAWGSSAGGHLAALLGTSGSVTKLEDLGMGNSHYSSRVQAVVDWYGPTDLLQMGAHALPCSKIDHNSGNSPESQLIGCPIQTCKDKARRANPITYISKGDPPFLILHGTNDCVVSPHQSQLLYTALRAAGLKASLHLLQGGGHGGEHFTADATIRLVEQFLDKTLRFSVVE